MGPSCKRPAPAAERACSSHLSCWHSRFAPSLPAFLRPWGFRRSVAWSQGWVRGTEPGPSLQTHLTCALSWHSHPAGQLAATMLLPKDSERCLGLCRQPLCSGCQLSHKSVARGTRVQGMWPCARQEVSCDRPRVLGMGPSSGQGWWAL